MQIGPETSEFPDKIAQLVVIDKTKAEGNVIFNLPSEVIGLLIVRVKVYLVTALTVVLATTIPPESCPVTAVKV